jgi:hypothetical protein
VGNIFSDNNWNESLQDIRIYNFVREVNFNESKNLTGKMRCFSILTLMNLLWLLLMERLKIDRRWHSNVFFVRMFRTVDNDIGIGIGRR